ncbi:MAG: DUF21 domain-containing protein [Planctomycetes bacterium]|nr:DUF21 domain-containing protein [Planctomycetota bacterium]
MNLWVDLLVLVICLVLSALYSGAETAFYRASKVRVDMEARAGSVTARLVSRLLSNGTALVIVIVVGINLCLEFMTRTSEHLLRAVGVPDVGLELWLTLILTPIVFFFGELLPKELARRRPHAWLRIIAPIMIFTRYALWPVERALYAITWIVTRLFGFQERLFLAGQGRDAVLDFLREGQKSGAIPHSAEVMARNVLNLRTIPVERCMVPWKDVTRLDARDAEVDLYAAVSHSKRTRLPIVGADGAVEGYVHQLDVLGAGPAEPVLSHRRELTLLAPGTPVDRALSRLRIAGQRLAVVGDAQKPLGIVTLKDLLEEISGDLAGW